MAFAGAQLVQAHGDVRGDRVDQVVQGLAPLPIAVERPVADREIGLVRHETERSGADGFLVEQFRPLRLHQAVGIFRRLDRQERHGEIGQERGFRPVQRDAHRMVVQLLHRLQQGGQPHAAEVVVSCRADIVVGMIALPLPLDREQHVVGIERPAGREMPIGMKPHVPAQTKLVNQAVVGNRIGFGKGRSDKLRVAAEFHQIVEQRAGRIHAGAGGGHLRVEALRIAFRAVDERLVGLCSAGRSRNHDESRQPLREPFGESLRRQRHFTAPARIVLLSQARSYQ